LCEGSSLVTAGRGVGPGTHEEADVVRVWLIRHGQSESNAGLPSRDWRGIPLTELGRRQAEHMAGAFADPPRFIVTSPYLRARQTAQPTIERYPEAACAEWPVQEFSYLRALDGRATTAREREPEVRAYWERADPQHTEPGAESFAGLIGRVTTFVGRVGERDTGPVAVFTHGIFMRAVAWHLLTGVADPTFQVQTGLAESKNMLRVFYPWPVMTDFMARYMSNMSNGKKTLHYASAVWQNEPFDD